MKVLVVLLLAAFVYAASGQQGKIIYHESQPVAIYEANILIKQGSYAIAAYGSNGGAVRQFDVVDVENGSAKKFWTFNGTDFELSGTPLSSNFASIEFNAVYNTSTNSTIRIFSAESSTQPAPLWMSVYPGTLPGGSSIRMSKNGQVVALLLFNYPGKAGSHAFWFNARTGAVIGSWSSNQSELGAAQISDDGKILSFISADIIYVLDISGREAKVLLAHNPGFSPACFCMSPSGHSIFYSFNEGYLWSYSASQNKYVQSWTVERSTRYVSVVCSVSQNHVAVGYLVEQYNQNSYEVFSLQDGKAVWVWQAKKEVGGGQDVPADIQFSEDGKMIAAASWGDYERSAPQLNVFSVSKSDGPVWNYTTPGSMFQIGITVSEKLGGYVVIGSGKHVHANTWGDGGDLYIALIK